MSLKYLVTIRRFSTSRTLRESLISSEYKSRRLWDERFTCPMLSDESVVRPINNKIITGDDLTNLEMDIFINIAVPRDGEIAQLQESVRLLRKFRKSLYAHTLLPSSHHAICRLFLYSNQLPPLVTLLENRVELGIFPDFYALNLVLDYAIDVEDFAAASRIATLVMLQEEFGINQITDALSLYSLAKYIESKSNFEDWPIDGSNLLDPIFMDQLSDSIDSGSKDEKEEKKESADEEDEDEAEYIRVPFLRNSYDDNHFDLKNPRLLCGKAVLMLGKTYMPQDSSLGYKAMCLGHILLGDFQNAQELLEKKGSDLGSMKELFEYYINNLHGLNEPSADDREALLASLRSVKGEGQYMSELAKSKTRDLKDAEKDDIQKLTASLPEWARMRQEILRQRAEREARDKLIAEVRAKKEELRLREQYLYFYDNLKKSRLTRIEYE